MYQYTTEAMILVIEGIDFADVDSFRVKIRGTRGEILKTISASSSVVDAEENTVKVALTQEETASLGRGYSQVQVRIITDDSDVLATNKVKTKVDSVLDEVVI